MDLERSSRGFEGFRDSDMFLQRIRLDMHSFFILYMVFNHFCSLNSLFLLWFMRCHSLGSEFENRRPESEPSRFKSFI